MLTLLTQEELDTADLTVYSTAVYSSDPATDHTVSVYFERRKICHCASMIEAVLTVFMLYYVLDVQYANELSKTLNFLDACVGRVDKFLKVRPCVQRKLNILMGE